MRIPLMAALVLAVMRLEPTRGGEVRVLDGSLSANGRIVASVVYVDSDAELSGSGTLEADCVVAGTVAPGAERGRAPGQLAVNGSLLFIPGSVYACTVVTHTLLDSILCGDQVSGIAGVIPLRVAGAIPVRMPIVTSVLPSDYDGFSLIGPARDEWALSRNVLNLFLTDPWGDTDADGLPDCWELEYFHNRTNALANGQSDSDGVENLQEYIAGTVPTNGTSFFSIIDIRSLTTNVVAVTWPAVAGRSYSLYKASSCTNGWTLVAVSNFYLSGACTVTNTEDAETMLYHATAAYPIEE